MKQDQMIVLNLVLNSKPKAGALLNTPSKYLLKAEISLLFMTQEAYLLIYVLLNLTSKSVFFLKF